METPRRSAAHLVVGFITLISVCWVRAEPPGKPASPPVADWVKKSNQNARLMVELMAKLQPEAASQFGVEGYDDQISDLAPGFVERQLEAIREVQAKLTGRLATETDPRVKQDLEILVKAAADSIKGTELSEKLEIPYFSLDELMFGSFRGLLDDQVAASRRPASLVRLRKYAGLEPGTKPITEHAMSYIRERLGNPKLLAPVKSKVEKDLAQASFFVAGVGKLFEKFKIQGYEPAYDKLKDQLAGWGEFVKSEVLPRSRQDFRLPPELYAFRLEEIGIDIPPAELAAKAHVAFAEIQAKMQVVAAQVANDKGLPSSDYRDVIKALKKEQLVGDAILTHYQSRLKQIEEIIRDKRILTLPGRPARIRIATEAESAATPAPNMHPPRLLGNTGEVGEFVLPLNVPDKSGKMQKFDDFNFAAASWTLTAHEARPGHELQFASVIEHGVSDARATFAFNSTNVEGWGLYAEWLIEPYEPADGHLICLQHRLMRAARAFLDSELQTGKLTREQALAILKNDVVLSDAMANQEVERYTFWAPGQANAYFYGYIRLRELRDQVEKAMGSRFNSKAFHDFILAQGLLPPHLLKKVVFDEFMRQPSAPRAAGLKGSAVQSGGRPLGARGGDRWPVARHAVCAVIGGAAPPPICADRQDNTLVRVAPLLQLAAN